MALRRRHGLTQSALAARLGISPSYLNLIEHDRRPARSPLLARLALLLDVEPDTLVDDTPPSTVGQLREVLADPLLVDAPVPESELRAAVVQAPALVQAVFQLHAALIAARTRSAARGTPSQTPSKPVRR